MSQKILIVEESKAIAGMLSARIVSELSLQVCVASSYAEAVGLLDEGAEKAGVSSSGANSRSRPLSGSSCPDCWGGEKAETLHGFSWTWQESPDWSAPPAQIELSLTTPLSLLVKTKFLSNGSPETRDIFLTTSPYTYFLSPIPISSL